MLSPEEKPFPSLICSSSERTQQIHCLLLSTLIYNIKCAINVWKSVKEVLCQVKYIISKTLLKTQNILICYSSIGTIWKIRWIARHKQIKVISGLIHLKFDQNTFRNIIIKNVVFWDVQHCCHSKVYGTKHSQILVQTWLLVRTFFSFPLLS